MPTINHQAELDKYSVYKLTKDLGKEIQNNFL